MEILSSVLPIILYVAAIVLLIILIIIGIRVLQMLNRLDSVIAEVEDKAATLSSSLAKMNRAVTGITNISDSVIFGVTSAVSKIFNKKRKEEDNIYE